MEEKVAGLKAAIEEKFRDEIDVGKIANRPVEGGIPFEFASLSRSELEFEMARKSTAIMEDLDLAKRYDDFVTNSRKLKNRNIFRKTFFKTLLFPLFLRIYMPHKYRHTINDWIFCNQGLLSRLEGIDQKLDELETVVKEHRAKISGGKNEEL